MEEIYVVLGGNGFIGYGVVLELVRQNKKVRCVDYNLPEQEFRFKNIEYCTGDIREKYFISKVLGGAEVVMDFIATTMPNTKDISIVNEIDSTLRHHDYILSAMQEYGVRRYVFPSSGGAIYGDLTHDVAYESDSLHPITPYGVGKQMTEDLIKYYYNKCNISSYVFRIGNVYGSPRYRKKAQGIVDIFIQNALDNQKITIWGNAEQSIRDYVHLDDVANAIVSIGQRKKEGVNIYNIGTGIGTSTLQLIDVIQRKMDKTLDIEHREELASGLSKIILSPDKAYKELGWKASISIEEGIEKTIKTKKQLILHESNDQEN